MSDSETSPRDVMPVLEIAPTLIGASRVEQIEDAVGALQNLEFTAEQLASIEQILAG